MKCLKKVVRHGDGLAIIIPTQIIRSQKIVLGSLLEIDIHNTGETYPKRTEVKQNDKDNQPEPGRTSRSDTVAQI